MLFPKTEDWAVLPKDFLKIHKIISKEVKPICIYDFQQIGITDPFPFENDHQLDMPAVIILPH